MAHAIFTKELAFKTAEELITEGIRPTISNIRERMGGGSPNDLTKWMREFNARQQQVAIAQQVPVPAAIQTTATELLNHLLAQTWDTAREAANEKLTKERQALEDDRQALELETSEALEQAELLYQENENLKSELDSSNQQYQTDQQTIGELAQELKQSQLQVNQLQSSITDMQAKLDNLQNSLTEALELKRLVEIEVAKKEGELKEIVRQRESLTAANVTLNHEIESLKVQLQTQQISLNNNAEKISELKAELSEAKAESKAANASASELNGSLKTAQAEINHLRELMRTEKTEQQQEAIKPKK